MGSFELSNRETWKDSFITKKSDGKENKSFHVRSTKLAIYLSFVVKIMLNKNEIYREYSLYWT